MVEIGKQQRQAAHRDASVDSVVHVQRVPGRATLDDAAGDRAVQMRGDGSGDEAGVHAAAARGIATSSSPLPFGDKIQQLFGRHDISGVQAHTGPDAAASTRAMGADAYATGHHVVLGGKADLHTVAHEAAHVVQQRGGVQLKGGVGEVGDAHERHADAVADLVVQGKSAEALLSSYAPGGASASASGPVQRKWGGDIPVSTSDSEILRQLREAYPSCEMPPQWKITKLRTDDTNVYKSLAEIKDALGLKDKPSSGPSSSQPEPPKPEPSKLEPPRPQVTSPPPVRSLPQLPDSSPKPQVSSTPEPTPKREPEITISSSSRQDKPSKEESHDEESHEYEIVKQLGDGSHHAAYVLKGIDEWVLLVNTGGHIEETVRKRQAAYSKFPESIVAKMGGIVTAYQGKTPMRGVLLEKMSGEAFHSTRQAWGFGLSKTVARWVSEDVSQAKSEAKARMVKAMKGMDLFIGAGNVVDDFQYWITDDGSFKLSDVKSAERGNVREIHRELVNCRAKMEIEFNKLPT